MLTGQQPTVVGVSIFLISIATIFGVLRFVARSLGRNGFWWDDWCSIVALLLSYGLNIVQFVDVAKCGLGKHTSNGPENGPVCMVKSLYAIEPVYALCMPSIKMTMVLFYWRLFSAYNWVRKALWITAALIIAWCIGALFSGIFQCDPISKYWDIEQPGTCVNGQVYFIAIAATNLVTDVIVLVLPLPIIWNLHVTKAQKVGLTFAFGVGGFVSIVSIVRILKLSNPPSDDPLWVTVPGTMWTAVETSIGVVSINLAVLYPLFRRRIRNSQHGSRSLGRSNRSVNYSKRFSRTLPRSHPSERYMNVDDDNEDSVRLQEPAKIWVSREVHIEEEENKTPSDTNIIPKEWDQKYPGVALSHV